VEIIGFFWADCMCLFVDYSYESYDGDTNFPVEIGMFLLYLFLSFPHLPPLSLSLSLWFLLLCSLSLTRSI